MTFLEFLFNLPFPTTLTYIISSLLLFLVGFGIYKFVKDWLPW